MAGLTSSGFVRKTAQEIFAAFVAEQRATVDAGVNTDEASLIGKYNAIYADAVAQAWEAAAGAYSALDRTQAGKATLDAIGELIGVPRRTATRSRVLLQLQLDAGVTVPAGSVVSVNGNPSARFVTLAAAANGEDEPTDVDAEAEAETAGPVTATENTLTVIETPVTGWIAVGNEDAATVGLPIETDAQYRVRQLQQLQAQGGGTRAGIEGDIARVQVDGDQVVTDVLVLENPDGIDDANGLPPHSFEAVVLAAPGATVEAAIAQSIASNKPAAVTAHGQLQVTVEDSQGVEHTVRFTRAIERPVYVQVTITLDPSEEYVEDEVLKQKLVDASIDPTNAAYLSIGSDVYAARLLCAILHLDGILDAVDGVSFTAGSYGSSLAISSREVARLAVERITVIGGPPV